MSHDQPISPPAAGPDLARLLFERVQDYAILLTDVEGRVLDWNPGAEKIFGWTHAEMIGRPAATIFTPEDRSQGSLEQEMAQAAAAGQAQDIRWHLRQDATRFWAQGVMTALRDASGTLHGYGKILHDATGRRQVEEALAISEERQRLALEGAAIGTWHWDLETDTLLFSDRCKSIFGLPLEAEIDYGRYLGLLHPEDRDSTERSVAHALTQRTGYDHEYRVLWPDHSVHWVNAKGRGYYDGERPLRFEGIVQDVTERKRVAQELAARADRESRLNRIGQVLRSSLDPAVVQARAVMALGKEMGVDRCYYSLFDETSDDVLVEQDWHRDDLPSLAGKHHLPDFGISVAEIYPADDTLTVDDARAPSARASVAARQSHARAFVSVPFFGGGRCVAALTVAMSDQSRPWSDSEVSLVESAALQIRAAIEVARIFQREQNIAVSLQEALQPALPRHVPGIDLAFFYKSALKESNVGGDFADAFTLERGCTALVVGDLSGKGLAAATQVATVRNMLRSVLYLQPTLQEAVTRLNDIVTRQGLLTGFVTLFIACYDATDRTLRYVSCGHEPGLVRRAATGQVEQLDPTGPIFGAAEGMRYEEKTVMLDMGDVLLLYTDGLTEAGPSRREFLGVPGMIRLLETGRGRDAASVVAEVIAGVQSFAQDVLRDDACLLAGAVQ